MTTSVPLSAAMSPGQDLWVLADRAHSQWTIKLNWYLNFHVREKLPLQKSSHRLQEIQELCGVPPVKVDLTDTAPTLVASAALLPNQWTLIVPYQEKDQWFRAVIPSVQAMGFNEIRLFLPDPISYQNELASLQRLPFKAFVVDSLAN